MAEITDHEPDAQPAGGPVTPKASKRPPRVERAARRQSPNDAMGDALRSVYRQTVEESVPDEFLDLLGKLD